MQGNVGSWSLAEAKNHMSFLALKGLTRAIEDVFNRFAIPRLVRLCGWPEALAPTFAFGEIDAGSLADVIGALVQSASAGLVTVGPELEAYVRARIGVPPEEEDSAGALQDALGSEIEQGEVEAAADAAGAAAAVVPIEQEERATVDVDEAGTVTGVAETVKALAEAGRIPLSGRPKGASIRASTAWRMGA
jgi:hypothetical protein